MGNELLLCLTIIGQAHHLGARWIAVIGSSVSRKDISESPATNAESNAGMKSRLLEITYVGGPTSLLEFGGLRFLTDPTFDPGGGAYKSSTATLHKLSGPALTSDQVKPFDYVLLSHDHHFDNLDHAGRALLDDAKLVLTTGEGATRLNGNTHGMRDWQNLDLPAQNGRTLRVVATPAQHGPEGLDRGAVTGFVLYFVDAPEEAIYFSGDTVWFEGVAEAARRFKIRVALLNLGAARVPEVGPFHLTMTAHEAVQAARTFTSAVIVPLHFEHWAHFSEGRPEITQAFRDAQMEDRLRWPERGKSIHIS